MSESEIVDCEVSGCDVCVNNFAILELLIAVKWHHDDCMKEGMCFLQRNDTTGAVCDDAICLFFTRR